MTHPKTPTPLEELADRVNRHFGDGGEDIPAYYDNQHRVSVLQEHLGLSQAELDSLRRPTQVRGASIAPTEPAA